MQSSSGSNFDISGFKALVDETPGAENGWVLDYEGVARKDHPESHMKIYKKIMDGEAIVTVRCEGYFKGLKAENLFKMMQDLSIRPKWDPLPKQLKLIEQLTANSDVIYTEANLPFPISNRDYVQERLFIDSKKDAELVKKLGLFDLKNRYFVLMVKSIERSDYPAQDKLVRGETKINYWFIQEDPNDSGSLRLLVVQCQDLKGIIPTMLVNKLAGSFPHKIIGALLDNYPKLF